MLEIVKQNQQQLAALEARLARDAEEIARLREENASLRMQQSDSELLDRLRGLEQLLANKGTSNAVSPLQLGVQRVKQPLWHLCFVHWLSHKLVIFLNATIC